MVRIGDFQWRLRCVVRKQLSMVVTMLVLVGLAAGGVSAPALAQEASNPNRRIGESTDPVTASIDVSRRTFEDGAATRVLIGRDDVFADSLAGAALAGTAGPILFTPGGAGAEPDGDVLRELARVLGQGLGCGDGSEVFVLGGENAISTQVETAIEEMGYCVDRIGGPSRVETSVLIAKRLATEAAIEQVLLARSDEWADAATGGAYAAATATPVLVTQGAALHPAVEGALAELSPDRIIALGGTAALSESVTQAAQRYGNVQRIAGAARDGTAVAIAEQLWADRQPTGITLLNGYSDIGWVYALAAAVPAALANAPQLYASDEGLSDTTAAYLDAATFSFVITVGPQSLVSDTVRSRAEGYALRPPLYLSEVRPVDSECCWDTEPASVNGTVYARNLVETVSSETTYLEYDLGRAYDRFLATIGLADDSRDAGATVQFDIFLDGQLVETHQLALGESVDVDVAVTDGLRLRLAITGLGTGVGRGVYGDAQVQTVVSVQDV